MGEASKRKRGRPRKTLLFPPASVGLPAANLEVNRAIPPLDGATMNGRGRVPSSGKKQRMTNMDITFQNFASFSHLNINMGEAIKRKRGRPRKTLLFPPASVGPPAANLEVNPAIPALDGATMNGRGRLPSSGKKQRMTDMGYTGTEFNQHPIAVKAGEVLTGPLLKLLYCLLLKLSPNDLLQQDRFGDAISMTVSNHWFITKIKYTDIIDLSNLLFEELPKQFEQLHAGSSSLPFRVVSDEQGRPTSDTEFSPEGFILLLRCSMIILQFLEFDLTLVLEKCQILIAVLGKLCPPNSPSYFPNRSTRPVDAINLEVGTPANFFSSVLEVFIDEFLVHHELRKHFTMTDCVSATNEKLFVSHCSHGDIHAIMELVSSHFLLSVYDEFAFNRFIQSLSWASEVDNEIPELGPDSALTLLGFPVMFSAPHLLQAHLILLASRCIGIHMPTYDRKSDVLVMNRYILAFELAVNLYSGYMPTLNFIDNIVGEGESSCAKGLSFDSCIRPMTCNKLSHQIDKLVDFCRPQSHGLLSGTEAEIANNTIAYIKGNLHFIDETFRDETCSILNYIITSILRWDKESLHENGESIQQEIYSVAAVLKLMSSSLLQIVWLLRQNGCLGGMKTLKHYVICKEYDFISGIISGFGNYGGNQPLQKILFNVMGSNPCRHKETKLMLSHFASLLLYSFRKKVDFLWKGCIFMMISLINLIIFEEGNLDAFEPLLSNLKEATFPRSSQAKNLKDLVHRRSSVRIASNLKKARDQIKDLRYEDHWMGNGEINEMETQDDQSNASNMLPTKDMEKHNTCKFEANTSNGDSFLECLPGYHNNPSEWEDLVNFIDCRPGKDYSSWLKKRARFRKWKHERMAVMKLCKKKKLVKELEAGSSQSNRSQGRKIKSKKRKRCF